MMPLFDVVFSVLGLLVLSPVLALVFAVGWLDTSSPLFWQERVGRHRKPFIVVKFRTKRSNTFSVATPLVDASAVTTLGSFLGRTKIDGVPQLWNVLTGGMSLVGPQPCLFNQEELIRERNKRSVYDARPSMTGLAQIQGIDMSNPKLLAEIDTKMLETLNLRTYIRCTLLTVVGKRCR